MRHDLKQLLAASLMTLLACGGDGTGPGNRNPDPAVTGIGTPIGGIETATIGAAGGSITSEDSRIAMTIPAGALAANTVISVQRISAEAPGGARAYRFTPDGLTFAQPVSVQFRYDSTMTAGSAPELMGIATQLANGTWELLPDSAVTLETSSASFTFRTLHFSDYTMVQGIQLRPPSGEVDPGESITLTIKYCTRIVETSGDNFSAFSIDCDDAPSVPGSDDDDLPALPQYRVDAASWAVNGTQGGNAAMGFAAGNAASGQYVAPADPPAINPAVVSVRAKKNNSSETATIVSYIKVKNSCGGSSVRGWPVIRAECYPDVMQGTTTTNISSGNQLLYTLTSTITWTVVPEQTTPLFVTYKATGSSQFTDHNPCLEIVPSTHIWGNSDQFSGGTMLVNLSEGTWAASGTALWPATYTDTCTEGNPSYEHAAGGAFLGADGDSIPENFHFTGTTDNGSVVTTYDFGPSGPFPLRRH